jgi:multiple antibiotic resistance protein
MLLTCVAIWLTFRSARFLSGHGAGRDGGDHRIMGFLLVCIGVQFVASGVRTFITGQ